MGHPGISTGRLLSSFSLAMISSVFDSVEDVESSKGLPGVVGSRQAILQGGKSIMDTVFGKGDQ